MTEENPVSKKKTNWKLIIGSLAIAAAVIYLLVSSTLSSMQYFITIDELLANPENYRDKTVRVSGAVIGDSIIVDTDSNTVVFTIANMSADHQAIADSGGMAAALKAAVEDPDANRINVIYHGVKPDLLKAESQAILTGKFGEDQRFEADELLLKCPTKYETAGK